jgi:nicotinamidase-related amidase
MPVVLTTSYEEGPNGPIAPGLKEMFPDVKIIKRQGEINAWDDPNFVKAVKATGRKKLIISGILTDVCVAFPTLSAIEEDMM